MQEMVVREEQRKKKYKDALLKQIEKLVPRLVKKAEHKSKRGKVVDVKLPIRPWFDTINYHPGKNSLFDQEAEVVEKQLRAWMVDEANKRLAKLGSPLRAYFDPTFAAMGMQSRNKLGVKLPPTI